jgi:cytochrome P450
VFFADLLRRNPYPLFSLLRRVRPVMHEPKRDVWLLFDFASVKRALEDHETFSSHAAPPGGGALDWLIFLDPPRHTKLRAIIQRTFTPRSIAALEPRIGELSRQLLEPALARGGMDLVTDYAVPLPVMVIAELIGIPLDDRVAFKRWSEAILGLGDTVLGGEIAARARTRYGAVKAEMQPYIAALAEARRMRPADDLLTRIVGAAVDGQRLDEQEIFDFAQLLILAGSETTTNLIGNTMICLGTHPRQRALLQRSPELLPAALEEVLRFRSPLQIAFRQTTREVTLHGRVIPAGKLVLPFLGSANRDPKHFRNAARFDITREGNSHVGFGHGIHYCIGAALARLEARVAVADLLRHDPRLAGSKRWAPRKALTVHGPASLPIRFAGRG